jgi:hypothetical protein
VSRAQLIVGAPVALAVSRFRFAKLRRAQPHPYALTETASALPKILWSEGWGPGLTDMVLAYGYPHAVSRPLIEVATCFAERHCFLPSLEEAITRAEHRDAFYARSEWVDSGGPFDPMPAISVPARDFGRDERTVGIDGEERATTVVSYGDYAALQFRQGSAVVTAVARLGFPDVLSFQAIHDLEPYFAGYRRFVLGWLNPSVP